MLFSISFNSAFTHNLLTL